MNQFTRRNFLLGTAAFAIGGQRLFAVPHGTAKCITRKPPNLVFGVLADTHLRISRKGGPDPKNWPDTYLVSAFRYFRSQNVDAVAICGDMADRGAIAEMQFHADVWQRVFGDGNRAADGRKVEKLFVNGNHDIEGYKYGTGFRLEQIWPDPQELAKHILATDMAANWERIWGEKYEPVWCKTVKGYNFFGMDWGAGENNLSKLISDTVSSDNKKPFFFITHDRTHKAFNESVKHHNGAFGIWGHWHMSASNWATIQMLSDTVPSVQCPPAYPYFNDGKWLGGGDAHISKAKIEEKLQGGIWRQGLLFRVYDDFISIERREFSKGGSLGPDWIMPLGKDSPHPFAREELMKVIGKPQFRKCSKLAVSINQVSQRMKIAIPLADGNSNSRVYAYEVEVAGDKDAPKLLKAVYAAGCNMGIGREPKKGVTMLEIPKSELPRGRRLTVSVRPLSSLGTNGNPIEAVLRV